MSRAFDHTALMEERRWIELCKKDIRYFEPIYNKYYDLLYRYLFRRTDDEELSADLCADTFYKALSTIERFEWREKPIGAWLFKIAGNELKKHYRNKKEVYLIEADKIVQENKVFQSRELEESQLIRVFTYLNESELRLVELKYFEGNTFKEISQLLDLKESAVKMRVYRLLTKLKNLIERIYDEV